MDEIWKDVVGYEGYYQVSSIGRVKSLNRIIERKDGLIREIHEHVLKFRTDTAGYSHTALNKNGKTINKKVHRLVALSFIPNPENKREVNHINGIKTDNRIENLEWATPKENSQHAYDSGLHIPYQIGLFGYDHPRSKEVFQYNRDGKYICKFGSTNEAQRKTGITQSKISMTCNGLRNHAGGFIWRYEQI